ncbi:DUF255 domain-containing protein [Halalkalicoccus ordinarius]|uniref:DUF255 domain-containing protein n=1 Tax=Halalkalicoccus ordinarius TaxID=3116651 RepID=UPI00300EC902
MDDPAAESPVDWREWGEPAFAAASEAGRPVLLSLSATWCEDCHEMDEETYANPQIVANVNDGFVPVRVDVDRHPRVRDRYNMGGFPSTVFCTPDGRILTGATALGPEGMRQVLKRVLEVWADRGEEAGRVPRALRDGTPPAGELRPDVEGRLVGRLEESFDAEHGGWGDDPKFPLPRTVEFALKREREQATRTLDAIRRHLFDDYDGGFFRYAAGRDWSDVAREKLLDTNAALCRTFANAYLATGEEYYREPAARTVGYLTTTLWTGDAFAASQAPGAGDSYGSPGTREGSAPPVDDLVLADRNAMAIDALLTYHAYTDDETARRFAERALEGLSALIEDGSVAHYDGGERDVLADQARTIEALTTAREVLGDEEALTTARAVADHTIETLHDGTAFHDGPASGPGLCSRPLYPLDTTIELADALIDLAVLADEPRYREHARGAVSAFAAASGRFGAEVASYGTVASRLNDHLVVRVGTPAGSDLHRAALRIADHEAVVVPEAPELDGVALARVGERESGTARTPAALERQISQLFAEG